MTLLAPPRTSDRAVLLLLMHTQLVFNLGFYAVVPFLAFVMTGDLGLGAAAVGLVLGARTASQQGMFLLGGVIADHWGPRRSIVVGCVLRAAGYLGLATADTFWPFLLGAILTGIGGAFFSPAVDGMIGSLDRSRGTGPEPRRTLFAWLVLFGEVGAVAGPLLGLALLPLGFPLVATIGACLFLSVGAALWFALPKANRHDDGGSGPPAVHPANPAGTRWACLADRRFLLFCGFFSINLLAWNQLYFALPLELADAGAGAGTLALLFTLASVLTIALQLPASALAARLGAGVALRAGFGCMALGFTAAALLSPVDAASSSVGGLAGPVALVALLSLGHMLAGPAGLQQVHAFAGERPLGAYYGLLASCGGVAVLLGNGIVGAMSDAVGRTAGWTVPAVLAAAAAVALPHLLPAPRSKDTPCAVALP